eukprot:g748.t1
MLQDVLSKTAQLLSLGFGEAGAAIIKHNLTANAELNPLLPGVKVYAVFGFCDIRRFTDTTECLQEDVMVFVNKIGTIVHDICHAYGGSANKNIGDAFLLAWKVDKPDSNMDLDLKKEPDWHRSDSNSANNSTNNSTNNSASNSASNSTNNSPQTSTCIPNTNMTGTATGTTGTASASAGAASVASPEETANAMASMISSSIRDSAHGPDSSSVAMSNRPSMRLRRRSNRSSTSSAVNADTSNSRRLGLRRQQSELRGDFSKFQRRRRNSDLRTLKDLQRDNLARERVSNALMSFLRTIVALEKSNREPTGLGFYARQQSIRARFGEGFEVKLGYGLHIGWSIEGAIGSMHKIDATYLSPHVNMAARLEAATKQFGVPLLFSSDFYACLPEEATSRCRKLDEVTVKGSTQPLGIYTFDIVPTRGTAIADVKDKLLGDGDGSSGGTSALFTWGPRSQSHADIIQTAVSAGGAGAVTTPTGKRMVRHVRKTVIGDGRMLRRLTGRKGSGGGIGGGGGNGSGYGSGGGGNGGSGNGDGGGGNEKTGSGSNMGGYAQAHHTVDETTICYGVKLTADFRYDPLVVQLQAGLPALFLPKWAEAVGAYTAGEWERARELLEEVLIMKPEDGPAVRLIAYMKQASAGASGAGGSGAGKGDSKTAGSGSASEAADAGVLRAPADWRGFRTLTEK